MKRALFALTVLAAACTAPRDRVPARLVIGGDTSRIVVADTAIVGMPLTLTFITFGGGLTTESAGSTVTVNGAVADVHAFNYRARGAVQTDDLRLIPHQATVAFQSAGTATIRVHGVTGSSGFDGPGDPIVLERTITLVFP